MYYYIYGSSTVQGLELNANEPVQINLLRSLINKNIAKKSLINWKFRTYLKFKVLADKGLGLHPHETCYKISNPKQTNPKRRVINWTRIDKGPRLDTELETLNSKPSVSGLLGSLVIFRAQGVGLNLKNFES